MSLLAYNELCILVEQGVITADMSQVNGSSIDITLDNVIMVEHSYLARTINLKDKENIIMNLLTMKDDGYVLDPNEFILASSREIFNLPNNISAEYKLKSSMARNGLNNLLAGHCGAGWCGTLTLELKNETRYHLLQLRPGMKIGQMLFFKHELVPEHVSYAVTGQYHNQSGVTASKGIR